MKNIWMLGTAVLCAISLVSCNMGNKPQPSKSNKSQKSTRSIVSQVEQNDEVQE